MCKSGLKKSICCQKNDWFSLANKKWKSFTAACKLHCTDQLSTMSLPATKYFNALLVQDNFKETYVNTLYHTHLREVNYQGYYDQ
jgi:hypothetical protein